MQKRLLPLLCLAISSQAYSEDSVTKQSVTLPQGEAQTPASSDTSQQAPSSTPKITFEEITEQPDESTSQIQEKSTNAQNPKQTSTPPEAEESSLSDDGIDEDLIAELLNEDDNSDNETEKVVTETKNISPSKDKNIAKEVTTTATPVGNSTWLPEIEFGYRSEQGNEDERSLNARLALSHISGRLRNTGEIKIYLKNEDGEEDEREQTYQLQSDYKISPKFYIYGNFKGIDSKYSSYFHDYTVSTGLGYQLTNTKTLKVETELGPGYRYQEPNTDEIDDDDPIFPDNVDEPIIRASLTAKWKPLDNTSFNFDGTMVSGSSNTRFDTEISIINNITEDIALKISQSIEHLSRVPNNLEKTDTIFTINVLYAPK